MARMALIPTISRHRIVSSTQHRVALVQCKGTFQIRRCPRHATIDMNASAATNVPAMQWCGCVLQSRQVEIGERLDRLIDQASSKGRARVGRWILLLYCRPMERTQFVMAERNI